MRNVSQCNAYKSVIENQKLHTVLSSLCPFLCPPHSPFRYPPRPLAFHSSEPLNATYHHISL